mmetsp:Transcript_58585/g.168191  ORF Transcript_58585/g.168191 Transcript_58585/m.168191 type:complete len:278 (-) Transcript_58585:136-969(-)
MRLRSSQVSLGVISDLHGPQLHARAPEAAVAGSGPSAARPSNRHGACGGIEADVREPELRLPQREILQGLHLPGLPQLQTLELRPSGSVLAVPLEHLGELILVEPSSLGHLIGQAALHDPRHPPGVLCCPRERRRRAVLRRVRGCRPMGLELRCCILFLLRQTCKLRGLALARRLTSGQLAPRLGQLPAQQRVLLALLGHIRLEGLALLLERMLLVLSRACVSATLPAEAHLQEPTLGLHGNEGQLATPELLLELLDARPPAARILPLGLVASALRH